MSERTTIPTVVLLLDRVRRVTEREARDAVSANIGEDAARTVCLLGGDAIKEYLTWEFDGCSYRLGTFSSACSETAAEIARFGAIAERGPDGPSRTEAARIWDAWKNHAAWLYVDVTATADGAMHLANVMRTAAWFIDEHCVLLWHLGAGPSRFQLPSDGAVAEIRLGRWPA